MKALAASLLTVTTFSASAMAQRQAAGDNTANAKVALRVFVSLSDTMTRYYPVRSFQLNFYRTATDSVVAHTDSTGAANVLLAPGEYRLVSARSVVWHGSAYSWNVPLVVRRGMTTLDLRGSEAERSDATPAMTVPAPRSEARLIEPTLAGSPPAAQSGSARGQESGRHGVWFYMGLGAGSLGCLDCSDRVNGLSGGLGIGGTINSHLQLGAMTAGWVKSEGGETLNASLLVAAVRVYPSSTSGFFFLGGLGISEVDYSASGLGSANASGSGALLGVGWDLRLGGNVNLTPFWNGAGITFSGGDANFGQIGIGLTIH